MFNKSKVNFLIDALMFLCLMSLAGIGFLIKYVLITGIERWDKFGRNVDMFFWGMDRHEWGKIHLIIAYILIGLLVLHIILHWKSILGMFRKFIPQKIIRQIITLIFIPVCLFLLLFFLIVNTDIQEFEQGRGRHGINRDITRAIETLTDPSENNMNRENRETGKVEEQMKIKKETSKTTEKIIDDTGKSAEETSKEIHDHIVSNIDVRGYMSLNELAKQYNIPVDYLKKNLKIPESISNEKNLGWLRKLYDFKMSDVRKIIEEYHRTHK